MIVYLTAGESHGPGLVGILDGLVAGVKVEPELIRRDLNLRRNHFGRGTRKEIEDEKFEIWGGIRDAQTTGAPIAVLIPNRDRKELYSSVIRPGHADLSGCLKYGFKNIHLVAERASARETAVRVALGAFAKMFLKNFGIEFLAHTVAIGDIALPKRLSWSEVKRRRLNSDIYCADLQRAKLMRQLIVKAEERGDTIGGRCELLIKNLPIGLGSFTQHSRRLTAALAGALFSIPAVREVKFGLGDLYGSKNNDQVELINGKIVYRHNHSGGLEGGMSNSQILRVELMIKPPPSLRKEFTALDLQGGDQAPAPILRGDTCVVPAAGIVAESVAALTIADFFLEKFGGDNLIETKCNFKTFQRSLKKFFRR